MDGVAVTVFLFAVFVGGYVQGTTGFALGIVLMAILRVTDTVEVAPAAAAIAVLAFANALVGLRGQYNKIDRPLLIQLSLGQVPLIFVGVWLLTLLTTHSAAVLELVLGLFIAVGSIAMIIRPVPLGNRSPAWGGVVAGAFGGLSGGMFAASGPSTGWFSYRQPLEVSAIRATLLAGLLITTSLRTTIVGVNGAFTPYVLSLVLLGLPVTVLSTWLASRYRLSGSETTMRRIVFLFLLATALAITVGAGATLATRFVS